MSSPSDICELGINLGYKCIEGVLPEKYFTLELNIIIGSLIKTIFGLVLIFNLEILEGSTLLFYSLIWTFQALFMKLETKYIYNGKSETSLREYLYGMMSFFQDLSFFIFLTEVTGKDDFIKFFSEGQFTFSGFYKALFAFLAFIDLLEIVIKLLPKKCRKQSQDYESPGQSQYFLKFRLLGGMIGIIIILIFYLSLKEKYKYSSFYQAFLPILMISELIILIPSVYYLCRKREKEMFFVSDVDATKKQLRMKKWFCTIIGFTYGLFEVAISIWIIGIEFLIFICPCYKKKTLGKFFLASKIIEYEVVDQRELQQEQLNPTIQI